MNRVIVPSRLGSPSTQSNGVDVSASFYIGDKITDVQPAITLGGQGILVRTGYGAELESQAPEGIQVVDDLRAASRVIMKGAEGSHIGS